MAKISFLLLLTACATEFKPKLNPYLLDIKNNRALAHEMFDSRNVKFRSLDFYPMSEVDGFYCISKQQFSELLSFAREIQKGP